MYSIIWNFGTDGWQFYEHSYDTPEEALTVARRLSWAEFKIIKEIEFVAKPIDSN